MVNSFADKANGSIQQEWAERVQERMKTILDKHDRDRDPLIPILQDVQRELGYIVPESPAAVSRQLRLSGNEILEVSSFHAQFTFSAPARHSVKVCLGTACHVKGGSKLLHTLDRDFGVECGEMTWHGRYDLAHSLSWLLRVFPGRTDRWQDFRQNRNKQVDLTAEIP